MLEKMKLYSMNEKEKQALINRLSKGRIENFKKYGKVGGKGKGSTGRPPFAYYYEGDKLKINSQKADWVRRIFAMRRDGYSLGDIADYLDSSCVETNRRKKFSRQAIKNILETRFYIGEVEYSGYRIEKHHDPIVSYRIYNVVN